jgi:glycosyltransferase involved in cell wall biosynthesis
MTGQRILFFSTTTGWAACEELWSQAALELLREGHEISASVSTPVHPRVNALQKTGLYIAPRPVEYSILERAWHYAFARVKEKWVLELRNVIRNKSPQLVVFSEGTTYPPIELIDVCVSAKLPFATISHKNWDALWQSDELAARYRHALGLAQRCYFVSRANLRLAEWQIGCELTNAEVVRNPYNVGFNAAPAWPRLEPNDQLRMACVARLDPGQKGHDLLFEALANESWAERNWHLSLFGRGPVRSPLERLATHFGIAERVTFAGHASSVEQIWAENHALVMASRYEGLPLAMVEAMLCGRAVVATDVAGHSELIVDGVTGFLAGPPAVASLLTALNRLWAERTNLRGIGRAGAERIRTLVPANPGRVFADKLKELIGVETH